MKLTSMSRYSTVQRYVDAATELEVAQQQRRPSLFTPAEVAELGELAFRGKGAEDMQAALDRMVDDAVSAALGDPANPEPDPASAELLGEDLHAAMGEYCAARAAFVVTQVERAERGGAPAAEAVDLEERGVPMRYRGVWSGERVYGVGDVTTDRSALWVGLAPSTGERPGTAPAWRLIQKAHSTKAPR